MRFLKNNVFLIVSVLSAFLIILPSVVLHRTNSLTGYSSHRALAVQLAGKDIAPPKLAADSFLVKRMQNGQVLLAKNETRPRPIASLTKLMTVVTFLEAGGLKNDWIYFSPDVKNTEEKMSKVVSGEKLRDRDVIKLALVESDNDAALALTKTVGYNTTSADFNERIERFMELMNEGSSKLNLTSTHFSNPTGLDDAANFSSAADLSILIDYINRYYGWLWDISRLTETSVFSQSGNEYKITNTNELLKKFPAIRGGKTGYTDEAGGALIFLYAMRSEELISVVLLGSSDRFGDGEKIIKWLELNYN